MLVTVIVASPLFRALTLPSSSTVKMFGSDEVKVYFLLVALEGETVTVMVCSPPSSILNVVLLRDTDSTFTVFGVGVTSFIGSSPPPQEEMPASTMAANTPNFKTFRFFIIFDIIIIIRGKDFYYTSLLLLSFV